MKTIVSAGERVFRLYHLHCVSPDLDTLFNLLNSIHSLNDKLEKSKLGDFFGIHEFVALKAIRNLFHHQEELVNELRIIPTDELPPITTDLMFLCLIPTKLVEQAISAIPNKYRREEEQIIQSVLGWYGEVVNINPCIFNFMVKVYEFETENNYSHYITGGISCLAGSVEEVLKKAFGPIT